MGKGWEGQASSRGQSGVRRKQSTDQSRGRGLGLWGAGALAQSGWTWINPHGRGASEEGSVTQECLDHKEGDLALSFDYGEAGQNKPEHSNVPR